MIKNLIYQTFKFCLVLAISQIPMGETTVGAEFISAAGNLLEKSAGKKNVEKVSSFFESLRIKTPSPSRRGVANQKKINWEKLKNVDPEDREELSKILERD